MATGRAHRIRGTRSDKGAQVRNQWLGATFSDCEPLTFGDLERGERFISMPRPGDNSGHGGLLDGAWIFMKIGPVVAKGRFNSILDNAVRLIDGVLSHMSDSMLVYKVQ